MKERKWGFPKTSEQSEEVKTETLTKTTASLYRVAAIPPPPLVKILVLRPREKTPFQKGGVFLAASGLIEK